MELVLLHGHDSMPGALLHVADAVRARFSHVSVRLLTGPVRLASGRFAWWDEADPQFSSAGGALEWIRPKLAERPAIVAGFSQGGALALAVWSAGLEAVAGVASVGGFLADDHPLAAGARSRSLFLGHGEADDIVDVFHAETLIRQATRLGISHGSLVHAGGHEWTPDVTEAFLLWLEPLFGEG